MHFLVKGSECEHGGCTALVAVMTHDRIMVANAGDSRAVLSLGGQALDMSHDHKPECRYILISADSCG